MTSIDDSSQLSELLSGSFPRSLLREASCFALVGSARLERVPSSLKVRCAADYTTSPDRRVIEGGMRQKADWTKKTLIQVVKANINMTDCLRALGLKAVGGNIHTFKKYIAKYNIDTSHFTGKSTIEKSPESKAMPASEFLIENSSMTTGNVKKRILKEGLLEYRCALCGLTDMWNGQKLVLHIDHINGINTDHRLCNLRFLCPNCHSQTDTYCGKNLLDENQEANKCVDCSAEIGRQSTRCKDCSNEYLRTKEKHFKIQWPDISALKQMVEEMGYCAAGRVLGVRDNTIRKHLKRNS